MSRRRLLVLSHVLPFPGGAGQQKRVFHTLRAARESFHITFVTAVPPGQVETIRAELAELCDEPIVMPSSYLRNELSHVWHRAAGSAYALASGLKLSNYIIGRVEFSPARIARLLNGTTWDCALFEYWHAVGCVREFHTRRIPCVLDMHDVLWHVREQRFREQPRLPAWYKRHVIRKYRDVEKAAWREFDGIVAINREEQDHVRAAVNTEVPVFYAPMGTDLSQWPYTWAPSRPIRVGYYGALGNQHNERAALQCFEGIMPEVWRCFPEAELWLIGSNPSPKLKALAEHPRVTVTGFVTDPQPVLASMSAVLCPWTGAYGFRSRLIEVMALGVPVVASPDAVRGMELEHGQGCLLAADNENLIAHTLRLLQDDGFANQQGLLARETVVRLFSLDNTYRRLVRELDAWL